MKNSRGKQRSSGRGRESASGLPGTEAAAVDVSFTSHILLLQAS